MRQVLILLAVLVIGAAAAIAFAWYAVPVDTRGEGAFDRRMPIPPLAESRIEDGVRVFDLTAEEGAAQLLAGRATSTWGFNGNYLGPTLRASVGEQVRVDVHNEVDEATTVHWHGMHLPAEQDGGPHQMVEPGTTWSPTWRIHQQAATLWYHPHPHGDTKHHVYRGLSGMFLIDDAANPASAQLPAEYGVDDLPVIVQDKSFDDGQLDEGSNLGDTIVVNGVHEPYVDVSTEAVRLRLLNASTARVYDFGFDDGRAFQIVASDGGLLPAPVTRNQVRLSPGERTEIVVRLAGGDAPVLQSSPPDLGTNTFNAAFEGGRDGFDVLQLRTAERLKQATRLPDQLAAAPDLDPENATITRRFELQGRAINGESMDMSRIDEVVEVDTTEVWEVANTDGGYHNFHIHDVAFRIADIDGADPPAELQGWKDTVMVEPGQTVRLVMRFTDYTDTDSPYMFHCHLLQHEDGDMMGQFVVVPPGHSNQVPDVIRHQH